MQQLRKSASFRWERFKPGESTRQNCLAKLFPREHHSRSIIYWRGGGCVWRLKISLTTRCQRLSPDCTDGVCPPRSCAQKKVTSHAFIAHRSGQEEQVPACGELVVRIAKPEQEQLPEVTTAQVFIVARVATSCQLTFDSHRHAANRYARCVEPARWAPVGGFRLQSCSFPPLPGPVRTDAYQSATNKS